MKNGRRKMHMDAGGDLPLGKTGVIIKIAAVLVIIILLVMSLKMFMDYRELNEQKRILQKRIEALNEEIDELKYYISAPMDEVYVRKFAKELLGLVPAGEIIYITDAD